MARLWSGMVILCKNLTIWPDPRDLLMAGSKLFLEFIISRAAVSMGHSHSQAALIKIPSTDLVKDIAEGRLAAVLKRDFSSHSNHVISQHTKDAIAQFENILREEEQAYASTDLPFPRPLWFLVPYNPALRYLGEIRVFLVNGIYFKQIVTTPPARGGPLEITEPKILTPLSLLRYVSIKLIGHSTLNHLCTASPHVR
jgi:hypothetical protein